MFQYIFNCPKADLAEEVSFTQHFSVEFETWDTNRLRSIRFWKGYFLCKTYICRTGIPSTGLSGELISLSRLLSVVSTKTDVVAFSGVPLDFVRTVDQRDTFPRGIQWCYIFESLSLQGLMHKSSYSVFGEIDLFWVIQDLIISLGGAKTEDWASKSPELTPVSFSSSLFP